MLIGRLGKLPEIRHTQSGTTVTSFSIATSENWKDKNTGEKREATEWHNIVAFNKLAEICGEYLVKGSLVYVCGKKVTDEYTDRDGVKRYSTKIQINEMKMLGGKPQGQRDEYTQKHPENTGSQVVPEEDDSDIPF